MAGIADPRTVKVLYKNWRGEVRERTIVPVVISWGSTQWHPEPQWLLTAKDLEDSEVKQFALRDCDFREFNTRQTT